MEIVKQNNGAFMWAFRICKRFSSFQLRSIAIFCSCPCEACTCVYSILAFQEHYHWKTMENDENTHAVPPLFSQSRMSDHVSLIFSWSVYLTNTAQISPSLSESSSYTSMNSRTASKTFMINMFEKSCKFGNFKYPWAPALLSNQFQTFGLL